MTVGVDLIEIERVRRALDRYPSFRERCFTAEERRYCDSRPNPAQHYAARFAGKEAVGKALGFGVARAFAWRDVEIAGPPEAGRAAVRPRRRVGGARRRRAARSLDDPLARAGRGGLRRGIGTERAWPDPSGGVPFEPLYTAEEMKAAEAGHDVPTMMERAGRAVAEEALRRYPDARSFGAVCGGGANGGDGRIALEVLRAAGRTCRGGDRGRRADRRPVRHRLPRRAAARRRPRLIEEVNGARRARSSRSTCPRAWTPTRARSPAPRSGPT